MAQILVDEGYIKGFTVVEDGKQGIIRMTLKYGENKSQVITGPAPGFQARPADLRIQRRYAQSDEGPGHCHRLHIQRTDDRPPGQKAEGRRRSTGFRLVR